MEANKMMHYQFVSDYAVIKFTVPGRTEWSEEEWDSAADSDLVSYVHNPEQYYMDDCWELPEGPNE